MKSKFFLHAFQRLVWAFVISCFGKTCYGNTCGFFEVLDRMKEIDIENVEDYRGFSLEDMQALHFLIDQSNAKRCCEVGTFIGNGSTRVFIAMDTQLTCVDHWKGNKNDFFMSLASRKYDFFEVCKGNISRSIRNEGINLINMDSVEAAQFYPDGFFDLVFIDADHTYKGCKRDILAWMPKVRKGGILCGHDYEGPMKDYPGYDFSDENLETKDFCLHYRIHPGVIRAVEEVLGDKFQYFSKSLVPYTSSTIWFYEIPN